MSLALGSVWLAATLAALLVTALAWRGGLIDQPNDRSAHVRPTPRAGGLGLAAGLGAGLLVAAGLPLAAPEAAGIAGIAALFALAGFVDDLFSPDERAKFVVFCALCFAMVWAAGPARTLALTPGLALDLPVWLGVAGSALWVFVAVNAANFMDGSDGMLGAVMLPASLGLCAAGLVAGAGGAYLPAMALAGALCGFLVFNAPPARVFAGDVGALGAGAAYAGASLALAGQGFSGALWLGPMFLLVFLADVLLTLLRRARRGRLSLSAHREHAYQRLLRAGWSHRRVALVYGGLTLAIVLTGLVAAQAPDGAVPLALAVWTGVLAALYRLCERIAPEPR